MYTNYGNISLTLAVWLAADDGYDLEYDPRVYSVTTLLQPVRSVVLTRRLKANQKAGSVDISDLVPARLGTAVHTAAEVAWLYSRNKAFMNLGIPSKIAERIVLNPEKEDDPNAIYVYMELRKQRKVNDMYVSGKFDFVYEGRVRDIKTTKTYNWIMGTNDEKYAMQGSIYRWLNPKIITDDFVDIEFLFTDWSPLKASIDKDYPQKRIMTRTIPLMSLENTDIFVKKQLKKLKECIDLIQADLPLCTPKELWMNPTKYAYYKNLTNKRATKLYDTAADANTQMIQDGNKGKVITRMAEPTFCKYCDARPICMQAEGYINQGILKL